MRLNTLAALLLCLLAALSTGCGEADADMTVHNTTNATDTTNTTNTTDITKAPNTTFTAEDCHALADDPEACRARLECTPMVLDTLTMLDGDQCQEVEVGIKYCLYTHNMGFNNGLQKWRYRDAQGRSYTVILGSGSYPLQTVGDWSHCQEGDEDACQCTTCTLNDSVCG